MRSTRTASVAACLTAAKCPTTGRKTSASKSRTNLGACEASPSFSTMAASVVHSTPRAPRGASANERIMCSIPCGSVQSSTSNAQAVLTKFCVLAWRLRVRADEAIDSSSGSWRHFREANDQRRFVSSCAVNFSMHVGMAAEAIEFSSVPSLKSQTATAHARLASSCARPMSWHRRRMAAAEIASSRVSSLTSRRANDHAMMDMSRSRYSGSLLMTSDDIELKKVVFLYFSCAKAHAVFVMFCTQPPFRGAMAARDGA
mmetsp:Transcript_9950/g.31600  ORF Transcript_9950/g.31600 Transcript_9950/m.31600 type:complete len:258 (-) Transcript_9950:632-1405(-)